MKLSASDGRLVEQWFILSTAAAALSLWALR